MSGFAERYERSWRELSDSERKFVTENPTVAVLFQAAAKKARLETERRFERRERHNGKGDAFRHCFWNALMVKVAGQQLAKEFADAHEQNPLQPEREKLMDLHNNHAGRWIGFLYQTRPESFVADKCMSALLDGRLRYF